jgi:hypothetical protein
MFRVDATPVECPFKGPLSFTYNRGHGECRSPVSSIDSCTEESRLLLRYQACPDVHGTESTGKEAVEQTPRHFAASEVRCVVALVSALSSLQCFVVHVFPTRAEYLIPNIIIVSTSL